MKRATPLAVFVLLVASFISRQAVAGDSAAVKRLFAHPPREYSSAPLWVWNDVLTKRQIVQSMRELAGQDVKQVFVHPRPGLMTPYLSPDWFRLWRAALKEAGRLDMNVWIYDENSYPSGFAGGWVPELMPESRGRGLDLRESKTVPSWSSNFVAVYRLTDSAAENISAPVRAGESLPEGRYLVAAVQRAGNSPWHGGRCYVDLMYPGVTEKFLEVTLGAYNREIGAQFGKRVPGVFTDEPNIRPAGGLPWTDGLPAAFEQCWGYSLIEHLASLRLPIGDWRRIRHNYFRVLNEQFIEHWAKPCHDYCAKHGLEWTGHYWDHEWPNCAGVPDNMAMYGWHQRPAIDCLMNQYREDTHAQFGNARMVRELASIANQLGAKRTLCELYGAGGWDLRFEDMKRIADWLAVLGVNTMDQHLAYVSMRGARKRDHPQSFSYHEPWWEAYHVSASYLSRLCAALSQGQQLNRILVLEPTTTAWMYQGEEAKLKEIGDQFFKLVMALEAAQVEYDLGSEDVIARHGALAGEIVTRPEGTCRAQLRVGQRSYDTVVVPPMVENLNGATAKLLKRFADTRYYGASRHHRLDGQSNAVTQSDSGERFEPPGDVNQFIVTDLKNRLAGEGVPPLLRQTKGFEIKRLPGDKGLLFHQRRQLNDGELLFLVNTSIVAPSQGEVVSPHQSAERLDLETGAVEPYPVVTTSAGRSVQFRLPCSGSLLLLLSDQALGPAPAGPERTASVISAAQPPVVCRLQPNVLTLDYVDVTAGGETRSNLYFYQAGQFAFQKNGMERNPWDSAVQFKDELITRKFPDTSGFTASYKFTIAEAVPKSLAIVIERPDLYTITCNGRAVTAAKHAWWLDRAFGRIKIAAAARVGENVVTLKAAPFTLYHELEPAYLLGGFSLRSAGRGFAIAPDSGLQLGRWNEQGHPFYSAGVGYRERFDLPKPAGRYVVFLPSWYGSVAKVSVNGKLAGYIAAPPWECDVTKQTKRGANTIEVEVIGTLKNTLGPHHGNPGLGSAWPGMFQRGPDGGPPPGANYATVGYGLFEPFVLKQVVR
jgi:hypothetical protein